MTCTHEWNPMPHMVDVICPRCEGHGLFEFAEVVKISLKKDVDFFQNNDLFEYQLFKDSCGHKWHGAIYYARLHGCSTKAISELPEGYEPENWDHSKYLYRNHGTALGAIICSSCHFRGKHELNWPKDAYFSIVYKSSVLWAFNRNSALELKKYIQSDGRDTKKYKWSNFLQHIPTLFKQRGVREEVVKKLNRVLNGASL